MSERISPKTDTEKRIVSIWDEVALEPIGVRDDYLAAGLDSVLALRVLDLLGRTFAVRVPVRTFFASGTIERLATFVDETVRANAAARIERELAEIEAMDDDHIAALVAEPGATATA